MRPLQSVQRRTRFETLEAKKLFAADLMGGAAIDLPDTAIVDGFCTVSPATGSLSPASIGLVNANLGGQEGEPLIEESDLAASIAPDGCVDLAEHVFGQYAEEIGAHNTQWDLLYAK